MQTQNVKSVGQVFKTEKQNFFETTQYLNLPDLQFFHWCNRQYGVNKGVYNTIDQWFYEHGIVHIHYRRIQLLAFLQFAKDEVVEQDQHKFIRFGHGGLTKKSRGIYE